MIVIDHVFRCVCVVGSQDCGRVAGRVMVHRFGCGEVVAGGGWAEGE